MTVALLAALPFLGAALPGLTIRFGRGLCSLTTATATATALLLLGWLAPTALAGAAPVSRIDWLPALGLTLQFRLDGLALLFALLILGIGLLVIAYAHFYLDKSESLGRFHSFLLLFQGAMLGIVLSDNLLLLLIFWELTSLASFLLIGFWSDRRESREGAVMALAVTGGGGLALLAGVLLLGQIAGSFEMAAVLAQRETVQASPLFLPALLLILTGSFAKSAQWPFHFWLPHAMAAPTPVSAYLHSATMVKAGLFLLARLSPVLAGGVDWTVLVAGTGLLTLLFGAKTALFQHDLKAILAFSTISHLGLITFLLGLGTPGATMAAMFHILCHASFKAALFLSVGIIDHATHSRDIRHLGGLRRAMPITFALTATAALAMAGVPPLNGFLSKEMLLDTAAHTVWADQAWLVPALVTAGAALSVAYSLRLLAAVFLGPTQSPVQAHDPGPGLWLPVAVLAGVVIAMGLLPMPLAAGLVKAATAAATGADGAALHAKIALWHGLSSPALWMSVMGFGGGLVLLGSQPSLARAWAALPRPDGKGLFDAGLAGAAKAAGRLTAVLDDGSLPRQIAIAVTASAALGLYAFATGPFAPGTRALTAIGPAPLAVGMVMLGAVAATVALHRQRLLALMLLGVVGLMLSLGFAYLAAPDLALTQITVEVVTVILLLLALPALPALTPAESGPARRLRDGGIALSAGLGMAALSYALMRREAAFTPISAFHLAQSKPAAGGTNAVNTIIVDFRGYDTFGEILVLGIAALVIFALAEALRPAAALPHKAPPPPATALLLQEVAGLLLPLAAMVGIYLFLRGHNQPGGGFVAALVFAIALVLQYLAAGLPADPARHSRRYAGLIALGGFVASATGIVAWIAGRPFLSSAYRHVELPPLAPFELASASMFDLGVFCCVLGAVMLALLSLARLTQALQAAARTGGP